MWLNPVTAAASQWNPSSSTSLLHVLFSHQMTCLYSEAAAGLKLCKGGMACSTGLRVQKRGMRPFSYPGPLAMCLMSHTCMSRVICDRCRCLLWCHWAVTEMFSGSEARCPWVTFGWIICPCVSSLYVLAWSYLPALLCMLPTLHHLFAPPSSFFFLTLSLSCKGKEMQQGSCNGKQCGCGCQFVAVREWLRSLP